MLVVYRNSLIYLLLLLPSLTSAFSLALSGNSGPDLVDASGNSFVQSLIAFIALNSVLIALVFRVSITKLTRALLPAALMLIWILLSVSWSDFPDLTLRRGAREVIEVLSVTLLALSFREEKSLLRILFWSFLVITFLDIVALLVGFRDGNGGGFSGIHGNKNTLGTIFFLAVPIFAIGIRDRGVSNSRMIALFAFVAGLLMLIISMSKSAIGLVALSGILVFSTRSILLPTVYSRVILPVIIFLLSISMALIIWSVGVDEVLRWFFGDSTFTGRDAIWRYALSKREGHELLGVGYGAVWQVGPEIEGIFKEWHINWLANEGHNGYIDIVTQLGDVGLVCLFAYLGLTLFRLLQIASANGTVAPNLINYSIYLFWGAILYNITESSFFRAGHPTWVLLVLVTISVTGLYSGLPKSSKSLSRWSPHTPTGTVP